MEDPPEDVFVSNVRAGGGDCLIFEGQWESSDACLQDLLDAIGRHGSQRAWSEELRSVEQLLRLSHEIACRSGLERWGTGAERRRARVPRLPRRQKVADRVVFGADVLSELGISTDSLSPFILDPSEYTRIRNDHLGHSRLERRPLLQIGDELVCALPSAISPAIRRYLIEVASSTGRLSQLQHQVRTWQEMQLFDDLIWRLQPRGAAPITIQRSVAAGQGISIAQVPLDRDGAAVVGLLHDNLEEIPIDGVDSFTATPPALEQAMLAQMAAAAKATEFVLGLLVFGGLGRGRMVALESLPPRCGFTALSLADLRIFGSVEDASLLRLAKLDAESDNLWRRRVNVVNMSGTLNLYGYWAQQGFTLLPDETGVEGPDLIHLAPNFLYDLRVAERRKTDRHLEPWPQSSAHVMVERLHANMFFPSRRLLPIYVAPDLLSGGQLAGLVVLQDVKVWVVADRPDHPELRWYQFKIWEALLDWLERASRFANLPWVAQKRVLRIHLGLNPENAWSKALSSGQFPTVQPPDVTFGRDGGSITLPAGFLTLLNRPTNDGERALLKGGLAVLLHALSVDDDAETIWMSAEDLAGAVLGGTARRTIHVFSHGGAIDALPTPAHPIPRMIQPEDRATAGRGRAWRLLSPMEEDLQVAGTPAAKKLIHGIVDTLWEDIRDTLAPMDCQDLVALALENGEGFAADREQWRRTAKAVLALAEDENEAFSVAGARESLRAASALANRVLVEMAVCTCRRQGGRRASWRMLDRCTAMIVELVELASYWDAIRGGLTNPELVVRPSGRLRIDYGYVTDVSGPFFSAMFDRGYARAASTYEGLYVPGPRGSASDWDDPKLKAAFAEEYRFSLDDALDVVGGLLDLALERNTRLVRTTNREVWKQLQNDRGLDRRLARAVLNQLTLPLRTRWDETPEGYDPSDWYPWRFKRRLSVSLRPLVVLGDRGSSPVLFGAHQLGTSVSYWIEGIRTGLFATEQFKSGPMKTYLSEVGIERGHTFAQSVADRLQELGWRTELEMPAPAVGGPERLGDFDVLAWHPEHSALLVAECKSMIPRKNTYELVEELLAFRGEATDRLGRHVARVRWVEANLDKVRRALSAPQEVTRIVPLMVTNRDVPMRYISGLPLPPEAFVTLEELDGALGF